MDTIFSTSAICFYLFAIFIFTQQRHLRNFKGASQTFHTLLTFFCFLGCLAGLVYLIFYGVRTMWWSPFVILAISAIGGGIVQGLISKIIPEFILSILGFIAIPVLGFLMFYTT